MRARKRTGERRCAVTTQRRVSDLEIARKRAVRPDVIELNIASTPRYCKFHDDLAASLVAARDGLPPSADAARAIRALRLAIETRGDVDRSIQPSEVIAALDKLDALEGTGPGGDDHV